MQERIDQELTLLRQRYPTLEYQKEGDWIRIPSYLLHEGWNRDETDVAFQIPSGYPGTPPYGIYVPSGLLFNGETPTEYKDSAPNQPPFEGHWGIFSWSPQNGQWIPTDNLKTGSNLVNWVAGFGDRFGEGR